MFPLGYFSNSYFAARYFPKAGGGAPPVPPSSQTSYAGGGIISNRPYTPPYVSEPRRASREIREDEEILII